MLIKYDNMLSRLDTIPERDGQTDGQNCYNNIARAIKKTKTIYENITNHNMSTIALCWFVVHCESEKNWTVFHLSITFANTVQF